MWRQEGKQLSLADAMVARRKGQNERLERIGALLNWGRIEQTLSADLRCGRRPSGVPAAADVEGPVAAAMVRAVGPGVGRGVGDRLSFRRFVGLVLDQQVPDHSTVSRFRAQLARRVERAGVRRGNRAVRAARIDAQARDADRRDVGQGGGGRAARGRAQGAAGRGFGVGPRRPVDPSQGRRRSHFGYKAHVASRRGSGIIREARLTGAKVNDTEAGDELISGDEGAVFADKAYDQRGRRELLAGWGSPTGSCAGLGGELPAIPSRAGGAQRRAEPDSRGGGEGVRRLMKRGYHYRRVRYRGLARNTVQLMLLCIAINLRRAHALSAA